MLGAVEDDEEEDEEEEEEEEWEEGTTRLNVGWITAGWS